MKAKDIKQKIMLWFNILTYKAMVEDKEIHVMERDDGRFEFSVWYIVRWYSPVAWVAMAVWVVAGLFGKDLYPWTNMEERFSVWIRRMNAPDKHMAGYYPFPVKDKKRNQEYRKQITYEKVTNRFE